jgi:hypothetical protein
MSTLALAKILFLLAGVSATTYATTSPNEPPLPTEHVKHDTTQALREVHSSVAGCVVLRIITTMITLISRHCTGLGTCRSGRHPCACLPVLTSLTPDFPSSSGNRLLLGQNGSLQHTVDRVIFRTLASSCRRNGHAIKNSVVSSHSS